jgi:uncharacterized membrane protein
MRNSNEMSIILMNFLLNVKISGVTQSTKSAVALKNKRKENDILSYVSTVIGSISWLLFLFALVMSYYAAPESHYGVLRYYDIDVRQFWLTPLTGYLYILLWLSALGSYVARIFDKYRNRRKSDNPHYNLVILLIINLTWLITILYHFHMQA